MDNNSNDDDDGKISGLKQNHIYAIIEIEFDGKIDAIRVLSFINPINENLGSVLFIAVIFTNVNDNFIYYL